MVGAGVVDDPGFLFVWVRMANSDEGVVLAREPEPEQSCRRAYFFGGGGGGTRVSRTVWLLSFLV